MRPMPYAIIGDARSIEELQAAMDATTAINRTQIRRGGIPPLYESGVVYERETRTAPPRGVERFQTARDALLLGHSDCDGLAPWRAAELQEQGEQARAKVIPSEAGYHVIVEREGGRIEDPSARLGMLDGHGVAGDDARPSARARRRRYMIALAARGERLTRAAASATGATRARLLAEASATGRALAGMERQAQADREPPITDEEIAAELDSPDVGRLVSSVRNRRKRKVDRAVQRDRERRELEDARADADESRRELEALEAEVIR